MGPTGSGKTAASVQVASVYPDRFEVVNCDSRQLYRGLEITTAAPDNLERKAIVHHLVSTLGPEQETTAYAYRNAARQAIDGILERNRIPLLVVGTGFYFKVLRTNLTELDVGEEVKARVRAIPESRRAQELRQIRPDLLAEAGGKIHSNDAYRIERALQMAFAPVRPEPAPALPFSFRAFYLDIPVEQLTQRLFERAGGMIDGMIGEIRAVHAEFGDCPGLRSLGVQLVREFLAGQFSREELIEKVWISHRQYAKRQRTWFRREIIERSGSVADFVAWVRLFVDP